MSQDEEKPKRRTILDDQINCQWCGKPNNIKAFRKTTRPAVPAESEIELEVTKATQTRLDEAEDQ
jgi:hypothetical protein